VCTITGVATFIVAFVGFSRRRLLDEVVHILSLAELQR
jgi:hypothetical protein